MQIGKTVKVHTNVPRPIPISIPTPVRTTPLPKRGPVEEPILITIPTRKTVEVGDESK
jgi:hypothetical protein